MTVERTAHASTAGLMKIGAWFLAALVFTAAPGLSTHAQSPSAGTFAHPGGSFHYGPGVPNRRPGNFGYRGRFHDWRGFGEEFEHRRHEFGPGIVVAPGVAVPPAPYYDAPPPGPGYDIGLSRCVLHRLVQTPTGPVMEPVYVC